VGFRSKETTGARRSYPTFGLWRCAIRSGYRPLHSHHFAENGNIIANIRLMAESASYDHVESFQEFPQTWESHRRK
jgi:hypothetical protein